MKTPDQQTITWGEYKNVAAVVGAALLISAAFWSNHTELILIAQKVDSLTEAHNKDIAALNLLEKDNIRIKQVIGLSQ